MRRNFLNDLIESYLRTPGAVDDHGTIVMRPRAYTIKALTLAVNEGASIVRRSPRGRKHRGFSEREVREALLSRPALITTRRHRPSGETLYKWIDVSDQEWARLNGSGMDLNIQRGRGGKLVSVRNVA